MMCAQGQVRVRAGQRGVCVAAGDEAEVLVRGPPARALRRRRAALRAGEQARAGLRLALPSGGLFQHGGCCVPELRHLVAQHSMLSSWKRLSASWCEVFCPTVG